MSIPPPLATALLIPPSCSVVCLSDSVSGLQAATYTQSVISFSPLLLIYSSHSWGSSCFGLCNQHVSNSNFGLSDSPGLQFPESGSFYSPVQLYVIDVGCSDFGIVILPVSPTVFELASPGFRSVISPVTAVQASMNSSASSSLPAVK